MKPTERKKQPRNRTLIRLRWAKRKAKRLGVLALAGAKVDYRGECDVRKTWVRYGWTPPVREVKP